MKRWKIWLKNSRKKSENNQGISVFLLDFKKGTAAPEEEFYSLRMEQEETGLSGLFSFKSKGFLSVFFCFVFLGTIWGQTGNSYVKEYNWRSGCRDTLPQWVFKPGEEVFLGISDPCLQPEAAREQAIQRALFVYGLQQGTELKVAFDYLTSVKERFSYDRETSKMLVLATCAFDSDFLRYEILNEYISRYGEVFVALTVRPGGKEGVRFSASAEFMIVEDKDLREEREIKIFLNLAAEGFEKIKTTTYSCKGGRSYRQILTTINDTSQLIPYGRYWYKDNGCGDEYKENACKMTDSFWGALTETLLNEITLYSFPTVYLKKMNENYGNIQQELKRELIKEKVSIKLESIGIRENLLQADWYIKIKN